jgi:hypothetical protein
MIDMNGSIDEIMNECDIIVESKKSSIGAEKINFQNIVNQLQAIMPNGWKKGIFMAEYTSGSYSMKCYADTGKGYKICNSRDISNAFKNINKELNSSRDSLDTDPWYSITIHFDKSGKFKSEFDYTSHDGDVLAYKKKWENKYIGKKSTNESVFESLFSQI